MLIKLFKKTKKYPIKCVDEYVKIIDGQDLEINRKVEFNIGNWGQENDYRDFMIDIQNLIEEYSQTGRVSEPDSTLYNDEMKRINNFKAAFTLEKIGDKVEVCKTLNNKYVVTSGFHRAYVAKKYHLKIAVVVTSEEFKE